jgi:hypothetical protein
LRLIDETFSGPVRVGAAKLARYVADRRHEYGTWLAERLAELEREESRTPAYHSSG